jgi:hypothetical protein
LLIPLDQPRWAKAEAELRSLAPTEREQFDGSGQPRPKTRAAKLKAKIDEAQSSKWPEILAGADERIDRAEDRERQLTDNNAIELAQRDYRAGEDDLAAGAELAEQLLEILQRVRGRMGSLTHTVASCRGRIDGRDIEVDPAIGELIERLRKYPDLAPPRSRTLTPLATENPAIVRGNSGGWISTAHGSDNFAEEQPERVEPRR